MDVSVVVTVLNEEGAVDELYRRIVAALDGRDWEVVFVDDGSTDGTFARLRALHEADPRVRVVRFKRNFGQHPAMHAGLARARGDAIVTMDGDLQNEPEDIPKLLAALDRADVASGRRVARRDSPGRTLPSRVDQRPAPPLHRRPDLRLRLRVQRLPARGDRADARRRSGSRSSRRRSCSRAAPPSRRSTSRTRRSQSGSRYSPLRLVRLALHVVAGFWPQPVQWIGVTLGLVCSLAAAALGDLRRRLLDRQQQLPRAALRRSRHCSRARHPGIRPGADRRVPRARSSGTSKAGRCTRSRRSLMKARAGHRRGGVHLVELHPPPARGDAVRGRHARRAHLRGQPREPRRRDEPRAALVRARRHPRRRRSCASSSRAST